MFIVPMKDWPALIAESMELTTFVIVSAAPVVALPPLVLFVTVAFPEAEARLMLLFMAAPVELLTVKLLFTLVEFCTLLRRAGLINKLPSTLPLIFAVNVATGLPVPSILLLDWSIFMMLASFCATPDTASPAVVLPTTSELPLIAVPATVLFIVADVVLFMPVLFLIPVFVDDVELGPVIPDKAEFAPGPAGLSVVAIGDVDELGVVVDGAVGSATGQPVGSPGSVV